MRLRQDREAADRGAWSGVMALLRWNQMYMPLIVHVMSFAVAKHKVSHRVVVSANKLLTPLPRKKATLVKWRIGVTPE